MVGLQCVCTVLNQHADDHHSVELAGVCLQEIAIVMDIGRVFDGRVIFVLKAETIPVPFCTD